MIYSKENKCAECNKVFCCVKCRQKHAEKMHTNLPNKPKIMCKICNGTTEAFALQKENSDEYLEHLCKVHIPLRCNKCLKIFSDISNFKDVKCKGMNNFLELQTNCADENVNNVNIVIKSLENKMSKMPNNSEKSLISFDSPYLGVGKNKQMSSSSDNAIDNLSSIRNVSCINNTNNQSNIASKTQSPRNNLVRTTSTPMHMLNNNNQGTFHSMSSSAGHMSSINNCTSEPDITPPIRAAKLSFSTISKTKPRNKLPVSATPLRQVMSRSIKKAMVNHGLVHAFNNNVSTPPLDLRTSPVVRRTKSLSITNSSISPEDRAVNVSNNVHEKNKSVDKYLDTVYETCQQSSLMPAVEDNSINSIEEEGPKLTENLLQTPRTTGVLKKTASFADRSQDANDSSIEETWSTPSLIPIKRNKYSPEEEEIQAKSFASSIEDDVFPLRKNIKVEESTDAKSTIWSMITSVIKIASFGKETDENSPPNSTNSQKSLLKRCASFAGFLGKSEEVMGNESDIKSIKRRRTSTIHGPTEAAYDIKRAKRIHGRPPIYRMRLDRESD